MCWTPQTNARYTPRHLGRFCPMAQGACCDGARSNDTEFGAGGETGSGSVPVPQKKPLALAGRPHYPKPMISRLLLSLLFVATFAGCEAPYKKSDEEDKKQPLKDQAKDQAFQAFLGRLRIAAGKKDKQTMAMMMTSDFGYRWDNAPPGEFVFDYWDRHNLWGELNNVLRQKFVAHDLYLVAPPEVVSDAKYQGYRAGMRLVRGSWRFAYFVPAAPEGPVPSAPVAPAPTPEAPASIVPGPGPQ